MISLCLDCGRERLRREEDKMVEINTEYDGVILEEEPILNFNLEKLKSLVIKQNEMSDRLGKMIDSLKRSQDDYVQPEQLKLRIYNPNQG